MGRFMRGAPVAYAEGGQSQTARVQLVPNGLTNEDKILRLLRNNPKRVRKLYPRLPWADVLKKLDWIGTAEPLASADTRDVDIELMQVVPQDMQHHVALALYDCGAPVESVRSAVELAWNTHSTFFMALAGEQAYDILRYCRFQPPAELGPVFPVWRGARGLTIEVARTGHSWTTNPLVAATWAESLGERDAGRLSGATLVLRREVQAGEVIFYSNRHGMAEVVLDAPPAGEVDGDPDEWREAAIKYSRMLTTNRAMARAVGGQWWQAGDVK